MRPGLAIALAVASAAVAATPAQAGLVAAYEVPGPGGLDLTLVDAQTGAPKTLPAGVNTDLGELHPSLSADGRYLAFERATLLADLAGVFTRTAPQVYVADLQTGRVAPAAASPFGPAGSNVGAGTPSFSAGPTFPELWTSVAGPTSSPQIVRLVDLDTTVPDFTRQTAWPLGFLTALGSVEYLNPLVVGTGPAIERVYGIVKRVPGTPPSAPGAGFVVDERAPPFATIVGNSPAFRFAIRLQDTQIVADAANRFRSFDSSGFEGAVPASVNDSNHPPTQPAWSADGNLLYYLRLLPNRTGAASRELSVLDLHAGVQAVTLGITRSPLPAEPSLVELVRVYGNLTVAPEVGPPTVIACAASCQNVVALGRLVPTIQVPSQRVGILVQRIVGTHRLLGKKLPLLQRVGRVPLGLRHRGTHRIPWDGKVNGRALPPGRYTITFRALDAKGHVVQVTDPGILTVRAHAPVVR